MGTDVIDVPHGERHGAARFCDPFHHSASLPSEQVYDFTCQHVEAEWIPLGARKIPRFGGHVRVQEESFGCKGGGDISSFEGEDEFAGVYVLTVGQSSPGIVRRPRTSGKLFEHQVVGFRQFGLQRFGVPWILGIQQKVQIHGDGEAVSGNPPSLSPPAERFQAVGTPEEARAFELFERSSRRV